MKQGTHTDPKAEAPVDSDHPTLFAVFIRRTSDIGGSYLWKTVEELKTAEIWERRYAPDAFIVEYRPVSGISDETGSRK